MPSIEKHVEISLKRTGREYREVHEWMDKNDLSCRERIARHKIINIPKFIPVIERKFGKDAVEEYLKHIESDYENNTLLRYLRGLKKLLLKG